MINRNRQEKFLSDNYLKTQEARRTMEEVQLAIAGIDPPPRSARVVKVKQRKTAPLKNKAARKARKRSR